MIVTIMQSAYLPWLGFFDRIAKSDLLIVLDHVTMDRNSKTKFANRNRIRTATGSTWLTVPILMRGHTRNLALSHIEIDNAQRWQQKHWRSIEMNYQRAPNYRAYADRLEPFYGRPWKHLSDLSNALVDTLLQFLGISTPYRLSSTMACEGTGSDLIVNLCRSAGATTYLSGPFGRDYLDRGSFADAGVKLLFHDYPHPHYAQVFDGFECYMSVIDLLFNHGPESLAILRSAEGGLTDI